MKRILLFLPFLIFALSFPAIAQNPKLSPDQSMILDLEVKWMTAVAKIPGIKANRARQIIMSLDDLLSGLPRFVSRIF